MFWVRIDAYIWYTCIIYKNIHGRYIHIYIYIYNLFGQPSVRSLFFALPGSIVSSPPLFSLSPSPISSFPLAAKNSVRLENRVLGQLHFWLFTISDAWLYVSTLKNLVFYFLSHWMGYERKWNTSFQQCKDRININ